MLREWIRVLACTGVGACAGVAVFGRSPLIWLGVLFGFLVGRTWMGLTGTRPHEAVGASFRSSPQWSLALVALGWTGALAVAGFAASVGLFGMEGSGLLFALVFLPAWAFCGLLGGPTATAVARRALHQVESGMRPEADRRRARRALHLSVGTTAVLLVLLVWVAVQMLG